MAEMNSVARFFVNRLAGRRIARRWEWLRSRLPQGPTGACLEIGCGNGEFAARFISEVHPERYVATDLDPRQLDAARRHLALRFPDGLPPALELDEADMLELPYPDASFDRVFAFLAIHHAGPNHHDFSNVPTALAEIDRVLRPGGTLAYEEFIHKDRIRAWLRGKGYVVAAEARHWNRETVVVRKPIALPTSSAT